MLVEVQQTWSTLTSLRFCMYLVSTSWIWSFSSWISWSGERRPWASREKAKQKVEERVVRRNAEGMTEHQRHKPKKETQLLLPRFNQLSVLSICRNRIGLTFFSLTWRVYRARQLRPVRSEMKLWAQHFLFFFTVFCHSANWRLLKLG